MSQKKEVIKLHSMYINLMKVCLEINFSRGSIYRELDLIELEPERNALISEIKKQASKMSINQLKDVYLKLGKDAEQCVINTKNKERACNILEVMAILHKKLEER